MNIRTLVLLSLTSSLVGCDAVRSILPSVAFDRMEIQSINWSGVETDFVFAVNNPSPVEIEITRFEYALEFDGNEWATGDGVGGLKMSAVDQSEMVLPTAINFAALYDVVNAEDGRDTLPYGITGTIGFDTPAGTIDLPFSHEGDFPALHTPQIWPTGLRVDAVDVLGGTVGLVVEMTAENRHASAFRLDDFKYRISMMDTDVIAGVIEDLGDVDGADTADFEVPMELKVLDLGSTIYTAVLDGEGEIDMDMDISASVVTPFGTIPFGATVSEDIRVR